MPGQERKSAAGRKASVSLLHLDFVYDFKDHINDFLICFRMISDQTTTALHFCLGGTSGKAACQSAQGFRRPKPTIEMIANGHVFRRCGEGPERLRANGQAEDELGHARACSEQRNKIGACSVRFSQTGKRMAAASIQAEPPGKIIDALFRAGAENDDGCCQFVGNDGRDIVNGLRIQADGQIPFAAFAGHCGHICLELAGNRGVYGHTVRFIIAKPLGVFPDRLNTHGMVGSIAFGHQLHIAGHEEEASAQNMSGQHVHDCRLPVCGRPSARSHFIKIEADYLGIANIELCRFLEQRISLNGIRQSTPDAENGRRLIGVLNPCILAKLR